MIVNWDVDGVVRRPVESYTFRILRIIKITKHLEKTSVSKNVY